MDCRNEDKYTSKEGRCCDRCPKGKHLQTDCTATETTQCTTCGRGFYTATKNHMPKCHICKDCSSNNNQQTLKDCTETQDTVCECMTGLYCSNDNCDHCQPVAHCLLGEGVKFQATRTNNTICAPCGKGTYSNVTDFHSPCQPHTRCEDYGRVVETLGTAMKDTVCGDFKSRCSWMLPAGLWSGLVLTILLVLLHVLWRAKRKSSRAVPSTVPVTLVEMVPAPPTALPEFSHCQETCIVDECKLSLFNSDDHPVNGSIHDSLDSSHPITPLKVSISFAESNHINGSTGYYTSNFLRSHSEPQEDEWCGT